MAAYASWEAIFTRDAGATWRDVLRACLYEPRVDDNGQKAHPLPVLLFLLDGLAILRCLGRGSSNGEGIDPERPFAAREGASDEEKAMTRAEVVEHFQIYLSELYLQPQDGDKAAPPFYLSRESVLSTLLLRQAIQIASEDDTLPAGTDAFLEALRSVCVECLDKLREYRSNTRDGRALLDLAGVESGEEGANASQESFSAVQATSDLLESISRQCFNLPSVNISLQATLVKALAPSTADLREATAKSARPASVSARRWILTSLLHHYLGSNSGFGQHKSASSSIRYALAEKDDAAIRAYFKRPGSISTPASTPSIEITVDTGKLKRSDSLKSTNTQLSLDPAAKAEIQQARRDDKLRWLFGENVSTKSLGIAKAYHSSSGVLSPTSPFAPPSPGKYSRLNHRRPEALRFPGAGAPVDRAPLSPPHRRAWSAGSEGTFRTAGGTPTEAMHSPSLAGGIPRSPITGSDMSIRQEAKTVTQSSSSDDVASISTAANDSTSALRNSLSRFNSIDTYDSSSALLGAGAHRRMNSAGSASPGAADLPYRGPFQSGLIRLDEASENSPPNAPLSTLTPDAKHKRHNSTSSTRSEPPFQRRDSIPLPSTVNNLTPQEKQTMVRKSRKLKAVLGEGADEVRLMQKQQNQRAASPEKPKYAADDVGEESSGMSRASSAALLSSASRTGDLTDTLTSPDMALQAKPKLATPVSAEEDTATTPTGDTARRGSLAEPPTPTFSTSTSDGDTGSPAHHQTHFPSSPSGTRHRVRRTPSGRRDPELQAKEARRRKLLKVQAFLGERVPLDALSEQAGPAKSPTSAKSGKRSTKLLSRAGSTLMSNKLAKVRPGLPSLGSKGSLSADDRDKPAFPSLRGSKKASRSKLSRVGFGSEGDEPLSADHGEWQFVQVDPKAAKARSAEAKRSAEPTSPGSAEDGFDPAVATFRRARKLEKVFGSLPPAQMYTSRRPTYQPQTAKKLVARDDRLPSMPSRSASFSRAGGDSLKSKSSSSSLYRQSLASLRYIAHSGDPELIDGLAKLVLAEEDESTDSEMETAQPRTARKGDSERKQTTEDDERKSILGDISGTDDDEHLALASKPGSEAGGALPRSSLETDLSTKGTFGHPRASVQSHTRTGSSLSTFSTFGTSPSGTTSRNPFTGSFYGPSSSTAAGALYPSRRFGRESAMSGMTAHSSADSAYAFDGVGHEGSPRSSMESVRIQFRRAHKLAKVFGTTRGEVFNKVLDDIEADMNEDEELDEEERRDVLENVAALRASL